MGHCWDTLTEDLDLSCNQQNTLLRCNYRLLAPVTVGNITANSNNDLLTISDKTVFPAVGRTAAILFVVDTSDPARQNVVERNIEHIEKLLSAGRAYHRFGLASFDKNLRLDAPIGATTTQIVEAAKRLRATGKTTELYRNVIKAIDALAAVKADRKAIFLFSDGQAEDRAYYHQDVIKAARKANVTINSLGYPRSVPLSVALQTIRRLSEESGGLYIETNEDFSLPYAFLGAPYENIDTGGMFTVDLGPVLTASSPASPQISLTFATTTGNISTAVPLTNPNRAAAPAITTVAAPQESQPVTPIRIIAPIQEPHEIDIWLWYGIPVAFLVLIVLTLIILVVTYQQLKSPRPASGKPVTGGYKPYAYLVVQDESRIRYPITNTTWRIGRTKDNELALNDKSVSRRHAEIQRYRNGNFVIFDVDSLNGVFVNSEQVKKKKLEEGDIIEIGDIYLRFTTQSADFSIEEDTAIQNTRTPLAH